MLVRRLMAGRTTSGNVIGIVVVVGLIGVSAYMDLGSDETASTTALNDQYRLNFVAGCVDSGAPEAYCGCMFDELKAAGFDTEGEAEQLARQQEAGVVPAPLAAAVEACA
jgi:hypothetical protein